MRYAAVLFVTAILLLPILLRINVFADMRRGKVYFALYLFRVFKIYGGYVTFYNRGIAFHLSKKKALLLPYSNIMNARSKFAVGKGFILLSVSQISDIGVKDNAAVCVFLAAAIHSVLAVVGGQLRKIKGCRNIQSSIMIQEGETCFKVSVTATLAFNLVILLVSSVKLLLQKIRGYVYENKRNG